MCGYVVKGVVCRCWLARSSRSLLYTGGSQN